MGEPRFLFIARVLPTPARRSPAGQDEAVPQIAWRLVGGNNHELGRSAPSYGALDACVEAVRTVQTRAGDLESEVVASESTAEWGWRLYLDGEPVATSARWYRRTREAHYNLTQFLTAAPVAGVSTVLGGQPRRRELFRPDFVIPHVTHDELAAPLDAPALAVPAESVGVSAQVEAS